MIDLLLFLLFLAISPMVYVAIVSIRDRWWDDADAMTRLADYRWTPLGWSEQLIDRAMILRADRERDARREMDERIAEYRAWVQAARTGWERRRLRYENWDLVQEISRRENR